MRRRRSEISTISQPETTASPTADAPPSKPAKPKKPKVDRSKVYVVVFNNSNVTGLAGKVAAQASQIGWQVVGSDNWYGTIPASTVYYPQRLAKAGQAARPRPRHPAHRAGRGPDAAGPAHRHPHRPARLTRCRPIPARRGTRVMGFGSWSSPRRWASSGTPRWSAPPPRPSSGLDFDGTLAPIVEDPSEAHIHPDAGQVLVDLAEQVLAVAVVTGRPARQALDLGGLERVGNAIGDAGKELYLFGQYGNERWTSTNRRVISPRPPHGLASFTADLPRLLRRLDAEDAHIEEKGLAVAVHTRRLADPERDLRRAAAGAARSWPPATTSSSSPASR